MAQFLIRVRKNGGAIAIGDALGYCEDENIRPGSRLCEERIGGDGCQAIERALAEGLVRGSQDRARLEPYSFSVWWEFHLSTEGEKFLRRWKWRRFRLPAMIAGGLVVGLESLVSLIIQVWFS